MKNVSPAKVLIVVIMVALYLANCILLLADTTSLLWGLLFIALHILYSFGLIWFYAYLKTRNKALWASLLIPFLTTTSTLGIAIWIVFQPVKKLKSRYPD